MAIATFLNRISPKTSTNTTTVPGSATYKHTNPPNLPTTLRHCGVARKTKTQYITHTQTMNHHRKRAFERASTNTAKTKGFISQNNLSDNFTDNKHCMNETNCNHVQICISTEYAAHTNSPTTQNTVVPELYFTINFNGNLLFWNFQALEGSQKNVRSSRKYPAKFWWVYVLLLVLMVTVLTNICHLYYQ